MCMYITKDISECSALDESQNVFKLSVCSSYIGQI